MDWNDMKDKVASGLTGLAGVAGKVCLACFGLAVLVWMGPIGWLIAGIAIGSYILKRKDNK